MAAGNDEIARMRDAIAVGHEQEMNWLVDHRIRLQLDECAIRNEGGVECGECVLIECRDLAQVPLDELRAGLNSLCEARHAHAVLHSSERGEIIGERTIHEHQRVPITLAELEPLEQRRCDARRVAYITLTARRATALLFSVRLGNCGQDERTLRYGRDTGEVPVFVLRRRKAK